MGKKTPAKREPKSKPKRPKLGGYLRIIPSSSRDTPLVVELTSPLVRIGRDPSLEVPLDDPLVADVHVQISHDGGQHVATAVGRMGFLANSRSVTRCRLKPGDRLRIGSTDIYYERRRTPPPRRAPAAISATGQLAAASQVVLGGASMGPVLQALLDTFVSMTQADTGFLVLFAQGQPQIHLGRNRHGETLSGAILQLSDSIIHTVTQTRESLLIPNVWASNYKNASSVVRLGLTSAFCLPLPESTHLVGVLYAGQTTGPPLNPACLAPTRILATQIAVLVRNALLTGALQLERPDAAVEPASLQGCQLLGKCPAIHEIRRDIERIARTRVSVLIVGEPGTGKTHAAHELYRLSQSQQPLIRIRAHELPQDPLFWSRITFGTLPPDLTLLIEDIETLPAELHSPLRELTLAQSSLRLVTTSSWNNTSFESSLVPSSTPSFRRPALSCLRFVRVAPMSWNWPNTSASRHAASATWRATLRRMRLRCSKLTTGPATSSSSRSASRAPWACAQTPPSVPMRSAWDRGPRCCPYEPHSNSSTSNT